jgi:hypothetical protein
MSNEPKFKLHVAAVKPGDFGPCGLAVWSPTGLVGTVTIYDGAIVEAMGPVDVCTEGAYDDKYEVAYRCVRTESGWVGRVCWSEYDGRSGFEAV